MSNLTKHYFVCANSAKGFQNYFASNLKGLDKIYILKGGPGTGKSSLMKKVGKTMEQKGFHIDYIHCSSDPDSLDGVIIIELSIAIVDGTSPHIVEPTAPGAIEEYINLGVAWDVDKLAKNKREILYLEEEISSCYPKAYDKFSEALAIHDEWEKIYIDHMNFKKANQLTDKVMHNLLGNTYFEKKSIIKHRFFGGSTSKGPVDFVETLLQTVNDHYYIKGRPGSGKSTMLKIILAAAQVRGINVEVFHCGFDPDSLDMLLIPELDLCIFDSTSPHEYFPSGPNDHIIDMYKELIDADTDETYAEQLSDITKRYKLCTKEGISHLAYAKLLHDDLEHYYIDATHFDEIDEITDALIENIISKIK